jgi:protease I
MATVPTNAKAPRTARPTPASASSQPTSPILPLPLWPGAGVGSTCGTSCIQGAHPGRRRLRRLRAARPAVPSRRGGDHRRRGWLGWAAGAGKKGHGPLSVDATVEQVAEPDFDALVIPGGYAPDKLRRSEAVLDLVRAFDAAGKPIAFICHAGWVPISAKILKGRRATSVGAIRDDMINAGADWIDETAVVDGNLISVRTPADLGPWMKALLSALDESRR